MEVRLSHLHGGFSQPCKSPNHPRGGKGNSRREGGRMGAHIVSSSGGKTPRKMAGLVRGRLTLCSKRRLLATSSFTKDRALLMPSLKRPLAWLRSSALAMRESSGTSSKTSSTVTVTVASHMPLGCLPRSLYLVHWECRKRTPAKRRTTHLDQRWASLSWQTSNQNAVQNRAVSYPCWR
jgi:hypothetical protein